MSECSRPDKLSHAQTILYEIDMLEFAARNLEGPNGHASWRNLECFLLHFRNLIEFFGKPPTRDDLSIERPEAIWPDQITRPSADVLQSLRRRDLWQKYEVRDQSCADDKISRYLHHCTPQRVVGKSWKVREMFNELEPVMIAFENLLPDRRRQWGDVPNLGRRVQTILPEDAGTGTVTNHGRLLDSIFENKKES